MIRAILDPQPLVTPLNAQQVRDHFRLLRAGLLAWMRGETQPEGMVSYAEFSAGVAGALDHVREHCKGQVLVVSSGGPISVAVGQVLATPAESVVELNLRIRNSAVTEFAFNAKRHTLLSFNHLPHLDAPDALALQTYA